MSSLRTVGFTCIAVMVLICWAQFASEPTIAKFPIQQKTIEVKTSTILGKDKSSLRDNSFDASGISSEFAKQPAKPQRSKEVGSEGYGPMIKAYAETGTPKQAFQAVALLNRCERIDEEVESTYKMLQDVDARRNPAGVMYLLESTLVEQRRCQTVTATESALRESLLQKASAGGVVGASASLLGYYAKNNLMVEPALRQTLYGIVRRDAFNGDIPSMLLMTTPSAERQISQEEADSFRLAQRLIAAGPETASSPAIKTFVEFQDKIFSQLSSFGVDLKFEPSAEAQLRAKEIAANYWKAEKAAEVTR